MLVKITAYVYCVQNKSRSTMAVSTSLLWANVSGIFCHGRTLSCSRIEQSNLFLTLFIQLATVRASVPPQCLEKDAELEPHTGFDPKEATDQRHFARHVAMCISFYS